jgi:hypothetical protein
VIKNTKSSRGNDLGNRIKKILWHQSEWLDLTGGDLKRGIDLLEEFPGKDWVCLGAIREWRELSRDLIGWALAATTGTSSTEWSRHARRSRLIHQLWDANYQAADSDSYVIVALPKEIALEVKSALQKLEYGEVDSILEPTKRKNYKDGWTIPEFRIRILRACHYCYGSGLSMAMARRRIADIVGEHFETLRNWDRALQGDKDYRWDMTKCQIAGAIASGTAVDEAIRRLRLELDEKRLAAVWDHYLRNPPGWDDKYLATLGEDYQRALKEQKQLAQRRKR